MAVVLNTGLNTAERFYEKSKNNVKYGTAAALAGGTYLTVKSPVFRKGVSKAAVYTGGKIADVFSWIGNKLGIKISKTKVGETVKDYVTKINNSEAAKTVKETASNIGKKASEQIGKIKASSFGATIAKGFNTVKNKIGDAALWVGKKIAPYVDKIPKKGILGAIALAAGVALVAISHKHGYNSGKIDQKYADKQELINRFQI